MILDWKKKKNQINFLFQHILNHQTEPKFDFSRDPTKVYNPKYQKPDQNLMLYL